MKRTATIFAIALLAMQGMSVSYAADAKRAETATTQDLPSITVEKVKRSLVSDKVSASGLVQHVELVAVAPQIEGQAIETLEVEVGTVVKAGDILARLSTSALELKRAQLDASLAAANATVAQAQAQIQDAKAAADQAERVSQRTDTLMKRGLSPTASAEQAESAMLSAKARLNSATQAEAAARAQLKVIDAQIAEVELSLARTEIRAPVDGLIVERNAQIGSVASAGAKSMFVILRDGKLELYGDIAEQDILRIKPGQKAILNVPGNREPLTGTVRLVEPTVSATSRLGRVRISIDQTDGVKWGMFAGATILVNEKEALVVPVSALETAPSGPYVMVVRDGAVVETPVTTGVRDGDLIEVRSGLGEGDLVISKAGAFVRDGDRVNPVLPADKTASN